MYYTSATLPIACVPREPADSTALVLPAPVMIAREVKRAPIVHPRKHQGPAVWPLYLVLLLTILLCFLATILIDFHK